MKFPGQCGILSPGIWAIRIFLRFQVNDIWIIFSPDSIKTKKDYTNHQYGNIYQVFHIKFLPGMGYVAKGIEIIFLKVIEFYHNIHT